MNWRLLRLRQPAAIRFLSAFGTTAWNFILLNIKEEDFENADIVFITDGECTLSQEYLDELHQEQIAHSFKVTGVLLDKGSPGTDFSLKEFCRTSELLRDDIVRSIVSKRV